MSPERERVIEALAVAIETEFLFLGHPHTRMPGTESVDCRRVARIAYDALLTLPDPVRDAAREVLAVHDDWLNVVRGEGGGGIVAAHKREMKAWEQLRAALEESET